MSKFLPDVLEKMYNQHRSPRTIGTPEVSPYFFAKWREENFMAALTYLVERSQNLGKHGASPFLKAVANIVGCFLLVIGVEQQKSPFGILKGATYSLLFFAQGEGGGGYSSGGGEEEESSEDDELECLHLSTYFSLDANCDVCANCGAKIVES